MTLLRGDLTTLVASDEGLRLQEEALCFNERQAGVECEVWLNDMAKLETTSSIEGAFTGHETQLLQMDLLRRGANLKNDFFDASNRWHEGREASPEYRALAEIIDGKVRPALEALCLQVKPIIEPLRKKLDELKV